MERYIAVGMVLVLISACGGGGGGGGDSAATPAPVETTDSPPAQQTVVTGESDVTDDLPSEEQSQPQEEPTNTIIDIQPINVRGAIETKPSSDVNVASSSEIEVPEGFALNSERGIHLTVKHPHHNKDSYLSVCTDFMAQDNDSYSINYQSCVLRTSLRESQYEVDLTLTNDVKEVVVALWFLDVSIEPAFMHWADNQEEI